MGEQLQSVCVFYYGDIVKLFTIVTFLYDDEPFPRQFPQNQRKTKEKQSKSKLVNLFHHAYLHEHARILIFKRILFSVDIFHGTLRKWSKHFTMMMNST